MRKGGIWSWGELSHISDFPQEIVDLPFGRLDPKAARHKTGSKTSPEAIARVLVEQMDARIGEIDADRSAVPTVEGFVGLHRDRAAVNPAGDQNVIAHELSRVDLADDLARTRFCDLAILGSDAGDRPRF